MPVRSPTTWNCPPGIPVGRAKDTEAVPQRSSGVTPLPCVTVTPEATTWSPTMTVTVSSWTAPGAFMSSDARSNATVAPGAYDVGAPAGNVTRTPRWDESTWSGSVAYCFM